MRLLPFLLIALSLGPSLAAQAPVVVLGTVRSSDGVALPQVALVLKGPSGSRTVLTGPEGRFKILALPPGEYTVGVEAPGFRVLGDGRASVSSGETHLDVVLAPAPLRDHIVVAATRSEAPSADLGVSTTVLEGEDIADRHAASFVDLLRDVPGVAAARAGGVGLESAVFLRGGESNFARVLVDGLPINEPGGFYNFGSLPPLELERVEIVRGAESSLYGTDALGGVIEIVTRRARPDETPGVHAEVEGGSFSFKRGEGGTSGRSGPVDWNVGAYRLETDNQQPNSAFRETAGAASLGFRLSDAGALRVFGRGETSSAGTPGPTAFGRPDLDASYEWRGLTLGAELRYVGASLSQALRGGFSLTDQLSLNPRDSGTYTPRYGDRVGSFPISDFPDPQGFQNDTRRLTLSYQAQVQAGRSVVLAGADLERETGSIGERSSPPLLSPTRTNFGAYVQDRIVLGQWAFLTLGGRVEHNESFGTKVVPRGAVAVRLRRGPDATTLHASAGAGIKEASFPESYGISFFAQGNPNLRPERSRTVDVGLEQRGLSGRLKADVTFFHHDYLDQIAYTIVDPATFQGTFVNLGKTRAQGIEVTVEAAPSPKVHFGAEYAYLDGTVLVSSSSFDPVYAVGQPLLRRPRHQASVSVRGEAGRFSLGASVLRVGSRGDSDFVGLSLTENAAYTRVDARVTARLGSAAQAFVVFENLLDRAYMEVLGYPALGRSVRGGLRFRTGGERR